MNISKLTQEFIQNHPYINNSLQKGLINYSSLARMIGREYNIDNFDAILIACRRIKQKSQPKEYQKIIEILKTSKIEIKNKILVTVLDSTIPKKNIELVARKVNREKEIFRLVESASAITLITSEDYLETIKKMLGTAIIKSTSGLVEITLKSSVDIEKIPGVISFVYSRLAEQGINIVETLSCWTDTILFLEEKDLAKAMELLKF